MVTPEPDSLICKQCACDNRGIFPYGHTADWIIGECSICERRKLVCEAREWDFPKRGLPPRDPEAELISLARQFLCRCEEDGQTFSREFEASFIALLEMVEERGIKIGQGRA